jgi:serine-type D-Ala-D-Ala carboxypeptidase (penicillin-binding protein 5/6)
MSHFLRFSLALALVLALPIAGQAATKKKKAAAAPAESAAAAKPADHDYTGAIVIDAADGKVLFEDGADTTAYPASVTKLMNLLLCLESIEAGKTHLSDQITADREDAQMGGTQVYLKEGEVFSMEDYLYAMMIPSANDAALVLAKHVAGSREAFVAAMNQRAAQLGMSRTHFVTPNGLVSPKQEADTSTPRDIATLSREVVKHALTFKFTATKERTFRKEPLLIMRNHNKLLLQVPGCDGLKTGYLTRGGFALSATVYRDGKRVIAVVMGSRGGVHGSQRDAIARRLIGEAMPKASPLPANMIPAAPEPEMAVPVGAETTSVVPAEEGGETEATEAQPTGEKPMVEFRTPGAKPAGTK